LDFVKNEMGIDHIINPDLTTAIEIERYLLKSYNFIPMILPREKFPWLISI